MRESDSGQPPRESSAAEIGERIADRYVILEELGHGGVATVYRALDERLQRPVALKRVHHEGARRGLVISGFEYEFQVLDQLAHPRIVRVYDYGHDDEAPYYTMELLEGETFKQRLPMELGELATVLRDVASSLALLHARRYVHRDVTPHNVWCERDGSAKLLDFGAMVPMGPTSHAMGTPAFVAPEVLHREPLDGRADIFALGALAYRGLTGTHAYPAKSLREAREIWRQGPPPPPTTQQAPRELSDLVMAMISVDRAGRPSTATEVMERLCAATGIPLDDDARTARAYLLSPPLIGRDKLRERARTDALKAGESRGRAWLVSAPPGMGQSRLLRELSREATQSGATVLHTDRLESGAREVMAQLARQAIEQLSEASLARAEPHAGILAHLGPRLFAGLGNPAVVDLPKDTADRTIAHHLHNWLLAVATRETLVIAVDDLHLADPVTASLLQRLSSGSHGRKLLMMMTRDGEAQPRVPGLEALFRSSTTAIELAPLQEQDVAQLTEALFWGADHLPAITSWMHRVSGGVPGTCMALAQHLLDTGLARYEAGRWHVPRYPEDHGLPTGLRGLVADQAARLSPLARRLACALALAYDDSRAQNEVTHRLTPAELAALIETPLDQVHRAMAELHAAGVVRRAGDLDAITHRAMAQHLREQLADDEARALHLGLSELLGAERSEAVASLRHLQLAGEHERAIDLLVRPGGGSRVGGRFDALRIAQTVEVCRAAIEYAKEHDLPRPRYARIYQTLAAVAAVYDWDLLSYLSEDFEHMLHESGIGDWDALAETTPEERILEACLRRGLERHQDAEDPHDALNDSLLHLSTNAMVIGQLATRAHDRQWLLRADVCLRRLALEHSVQVVEQYREWLEGRTNSVDPLDVAQGYLYQERLSVFLRYAAQGVHSNWAGAHMAALGKREAVDIGAHLESSVPGIWLAAYLCWIGHAFRCEGPQMKAWEERAIAVAPDDLWRRRGYLMFEARLHALTMDSLALKGVLEELDAIAERFEGWRPWRDWAWGEYLAISGSLEDANVALSRALAGARPGEHAAWGPAHATHIAVLARRGQHELAIERAREGLFMCNEHDLLPITRFDHHLALAEALGAAGSHDRAMEALGEATALCRAAGFDGIHLGRLHEARTRNALDRSDRAAAKKHLGRLAELFMASEMPQLTARYVRLADEVRRGTSRAIPGVRPDWLSGDDTAFQQRVQELLPGNENRDERARRALALLLESTGAQAGVIYLSDPEGLKVCGQIGGLRPDRALREEAARALAEATKPRETVAAGDTAATDTSMAASTRQTPRPIPLISGQHTAGIAMLEWDQDTPAPSTIAVQATATAIAAALQE